MNKTDAAEILQKYVFDDEECIAQDMKDYNEALKMAIEALKANDEINEMNRKIIKDILKMMPTAYLLEALGVDTFDELMKPADEQIQSMVEKRVAELVHLNYELEQQLADRPKGEWTEPQLIYTDAHKVTCTNCGGRVVIVGETNFCPNCGADMRGEKE